ncbi:hypothetical protein TIFTF001_015069 [Ficus carica]|uniref:Uncharacterized protein n=1 Tax=Ficus carica TaxID=3494 RepID=A0AA87ZY07_FICCA|nr:hypothetical protein TIFTF001_015069 [Ficus carica]
MASISPTVPQGGGSHENDRDLVGHSLTSDLGADDHEIRGDLNRDCDFLSILLSREVIFIVEIVIALRCGAGDDGDLTGEDEDAVGEWRSRRSFTESLAMSSSSLLVAGEVALLIALAMDILLHGGRSGREGKNDG